jgi:hypothetical protein
MKMICDQCGGKVPFEDLRNGKCPRCTAVTCIECGEPLNLQDPVTNGMCFKCAWGDPTPKPSKPPVVAQDASASLSDHSTAKTLAGVLAAILFVVLALSVAGEIAAAFTMSLGVILTSIVGWLLGKHLKGQQHAGALFGAWLGCFGWLVVLFLQDLRPRCPACKTLIYPGATVCASCRGPLA